MNVLAYRSETFFAGGFASHGYDFDHGAFLSFLPSFASELVLPQKSDWSVGHLTPDFGVKLFLRQIFVSSPAVGDGVKLRPLPFLPWSVEENLVLV